MDILDRILKIGDKYDISVKNEPMVLVLQI